ncbi:hypothetical protein MHLP_04495 [Candidatus Mycoplasma haematolamae str. Purdue]|uniref:Uncharacterized protein n=1 Tax=Mycoplasma haematolamae (strain Purdue) TaxID=1212765 RepID=I7CKV1_MYCHA|nr:hypothetical protein MHLP_04495 [Candidatus Mycoplasma haematolamae str. Purdue]
MSAHQTANPGSFPVKAIAKEIQSNKGKACKRGKPTDRIPSAIFVRVSPPPHPAMLPPNDRKKLVMAIVAIGSMKAPEMPESLSFKLLLDRLSLSRFWGLVTIPSIGQKG